MKDPREGQWQLIKIYLITVHCALLRELQLTIEIGKRFLVSYDSCVHTMNQEQLRSVLHVTAVI